MLHESLATFTRKGRTPLTAEQALRYLDQIAEWPVMVTDYGAIKTACELSARARLSFWDALVIVAAARSGAKRIYTEDLQDGQTILGMEIVNPFRPQ